MTAKELLEVCARLAQPEHVGDGFYRARQHEATTYELARMVIDMNAALEGKLAGLESQVHSLREELAHTRKTMRMREVFK